MGRRRRRSDTPQNLNPFDALPLPTLTPPALLGRFSVGGALPEVDDGRRYHPDLFAPLRQTDGTRAAPLRVTKKPFKRQLPFGLQFAVPEKTVVCVRRKQRKEVLHALRKTGSGRGRRKSPRRNWYSGVRC